MEVVVILLGGASLVALYFVIKMGVRNGIVEAWERRDALGRHRDGNPSGLPTGERPE